MPKKIKRARIVAAFGRRVRSLRLALGLSQEQLAFRAGLHPTFIGHVERGGRSVTLQSIEKIARGLKVSMSKLFKELK